MIKTKLHLINNKVLETPEFIPSLTSIKRYSSYMDLISFLTHQEISHYMVSAYDIYYLKKQIPTQILRKFKESSVLSFFDSGAFEVHNSSFALEWNNNLLINTIKEFNSDIVVSLDDISNHSKDSFLKDLSNYNALRNKLREDKQFYEVVIQGRNVDEIEFFLKNLEIDKKLLALCIPERNLGSSYSMRYKNLKNIIDLVKIEYGFEGLLFHLMGCSHPFLIMNYSNLGVDLFDGIHWHDSLFVPSKSDFTDLSLLLDINCSCHYCLEIREKRKINKDDFEKYHMYYALLHNLFHFKKLMKKIRSE